MAQTNWQEPERMTQIAGGVAVYYVADLLPKHRTKRYGKRPLGKITLCGVHHSAVLGKPGFQGLYNSAKNAVRDKPTRPERVFAGCNYHLWVPHQECVDDEDRLVIFQANPFEAITAHTKQLNQRAISICLQGNTSVDGFSAHQEECLEALIPWIDEGGHGGPSPSWYMHCNADKFGGIPKKECPGKGAVKWLEGYFGWSNSE